MRCPYPASFSWLETIGHGNAPFSPFKLDVLVFGTEVYETRLFDIDAKTYGYLKILRVLIGSCAPVGPS